LDGIRSRVFAQNQIRRQDLYWADQQSCGMRGSGRSNWGFAGRNILCGFAYA